MNFKKKKSEILFGYVRRFEDLADSLHDGFIHHCMAASGIADIAVAQQSLNTQGRTGKCRACGPLTSTFVIVFLRGGFRLFWYHPSAKVSEVYSRIDVWPTRNLQTSKKWKCLLKRHVCVYIYLRINIYICIYSFYYLHLYAYIFTHIHVYTYKLWIPVLFRSMHVVKKNHRTMSPTLGLGPLGLSKTRPWPQRPRKIHPRRWDGPQRRNRGSMISDLFFLTKGMGGVLGGCWCWGALCCYQRQKYMGVFFLKWEV